MTEWIDIAAKAFWCGTAAAGFGILFNTPTNALLPVWLGGFISGLIKFSVLNPLIGLGIVGASFLGALASGLVIVLIANWQNLPPLIIAIPSVIPLVPGVFAYKTLLGLMKLTHVMGDDYTATLSSTVHFGLKTLFVVLGICLGIVIPIQLFRKELVNNGSYSHPPNTR